MGRFEILKNRVKKAEPVKETNFKKRVFEDLRLTTASGFTVYVPPSAVVGRTFLDDSDFVVLEVKVPKASGRKILSDLVKPQGTSSLGPR